MPARRRIAVEMGLLVVLVFGGGFATSAIAAVILATVELAIATALVRPWSPRHGGVLARAATALVIAFAVVAPAIVERPSIAGQARRLGIGTAVSARQEGDPPLEGGIVLVKSVEEHAPADGVLRAGDRIVALDGKPLDRTDPASDLAQRTHGGDLPEDTHVTVLRDHTREELPVRIPKVHARRDFGRALNAVRDASARHIVAFAAVRGALLILLLVVMLRADGQSLEVLGIFKRGALREVLASSWITIGAFAVTVIVAIPAGLIAMAAGILQRESAQRTETLQTIASQGSIAEFALAAVVAATFEEIAFRGFLTPRMRTLVGSWPLAVGLVSIVFGLGHIYEGAIATVQTACLGAYFAAMMLVRRRLIGPALAHAAFNTIMLVFIRVVTSTNVIERLREAAAHAH